MRLTACNEYLNIFYRDDGSVRLINALRAGGPCIFRPSRNMCAVFLKRSLTDSFSQGLSRVTGYFFGIEYGSEISLEISVLYQ